MCHQKDGAWYQFDSDFRSVGTSFSEIFGSEVDVLVGYVNCEFIAGDFDALAKHVE